MGRLIGRAIGRQEALLTGGDVGGDVDIAPISLGGGRCDRTVAQLDYVPRHDVDITRVAAA